MGLPEAYVLPRGVSAALHVVGDGVCVPTVRWLADTLLEPLLEALPSSRV
jgi:DNA (cytosine-5)-methyltransferase 1